MPCYRRIRDLREDRDLTQAKMGEILSCSRSLLSNALFAAGYPLIATDTHVLFLRPTPYQEDQYFFVPRGDLFTATAAYPTVQLPDPLHPAG